MPSSTEILRAAERGEFPPMNARQVAMVAAIRQGKTLDDVGRAWGITRERVRQLVAPVAKELPEQHLVCSVENCENRATNLPPFICSYHRDRLRRHGTTDDPPTDEERFWQMVDKGSKDECWEWPESYRNPNGYGRCWWGKYRQIAYAHRVSWMIQNGEIPEDRPCVLHTCHNPPCVNPAHLYVGTQQDNVNDRQERGVWHEAMKRGRRGRRGLLDEDTIRKIRAVYDKARKPFAAAKGTPNGRKEVPNGLTRDLAKQFGVSRTTVCKVGRRKSYRYVEDE